MLQIEPVKLGLPVPGFNIPNNSEAATGGQETGHVICLPIATLGGLHVTSDHQQVFLSECKASPGCGGAARTTSFLLHQGGQCHPGPVGNRPAHL